MVVNLQRGRLLSFRYCPGSGEGTHAKYVIVPFMILLFIICQDKNLHEPEAFD